MNGPLCKLGLQHSQPAGQIDIVAYFIQFRAVDRSHIDGTLNNSLRQEIAQQLCGLNGNRFLSFHR